MARFTISVLALAQNVVTLYPASFAGVVELVDTRDLKSLASERGVPVQVRPPAYY